MNRIRTASFLIIIVSFIASTVNAQQWQFVNKKDSIYIYTRKDVGKKLKSFKAVTRIKAPAEKIFALLEDVNKTDWWDKSLSQIKVLRYVKNKLAQYYLVYDLPWPVIDRDVCVTVIDSVDRRKGIYTLKATPLSGVIAIQKDKVRITDYYQTWIVKSIAKDLSLVELEGYVDPAGSIPDWVFNMVIFKIPTNCIKGVRREMKKKISDN
ncbi:MAG: START domain-containing protein [Bacteroidota bacterium]|nr:START domain-containing protein [Bacteroidota bacterium]